MCNLKDCWQVRLTSKLSCLCTDLIYVDIWLEWFVGKGWVLLSSLYTFLSVSRDGSPDRVIHSLFFYADIGSFGLFYFKDDFFMSFRCFWPLAQRYRAGRSWSLGSLPCA